MYTTGKVVKYPIGLIRFAKFRIRVNKTPCSKVYVGHQTRGVNGIVSHSEKMLSQSQLILPQG